MLISILRQPDSVTGATEKNVYRFEERPNECNVQYEYILENRSAKIVIYPNEDPIKYIKLRKNHNDRVRHTLAARPLKY